MPIQLPYIQPLSFEQNNPFFSGMKQGGEIGAQQLANALQKIKLQYAPRRELADTRTAEEQAPYVHAQTGLVGAQTGAIPSEIALRGAQANQANSEANKNNYLVKNPSLIAGGQVAQDYADYLFRQSHGGNSTSQTPQAPPSQYQPTNMMQNLGGALSNASSAGGNSFSPVAVSQQQQADPNSLVAKLRQAFSSAGQQQPQQQQRNQNPTGMDLYEQYRQSEINKNNAYAQSGGRFATKLSKAEGDVTNSLVNDNANLYGDPDKTREAFNNILAGKNTMDDGTPINVSPVTQKALGELAQTQTTAGAYNSKLRSIQGNAAVNSLKDSAIQLRGDKGSSYFNVPVETAVKQFSDNPKTAREFAKYIASRAIQTETVKEMLFQIGTRPTVTDTNRILQDAMQQANIPNIRMTDEVRNMILEEMTKASQKAFEARNSVSSNYNDVMNGGVSNGNNPSVSQRKNTADSDPLGIL